jgi:hypothetical protein
MNKTRTLLTAIAFAAGSIASANTPLLTNTSFAGYEGWIFGANRFQPVTTWLSFVQAPSAFAYAERVQASGAGFTFTSWDDGIADRIETYIFQEFKAGPDTGAFGPSVFATGDVIVFKGSASATRTGANTSDMTVRAFIKVLGYNEFGWSHQTKMQYSAFHDIGSALEPFELRVTFPDLAVDDSLQVLQVGFEISTQYDGTAMDAGTIYFENIEGYIEGEPNGGDVYWNGYLVQDESYVDTGDFMGILHIASDPWIYIYAIARWAYLPDVQDIGTGLWLHVQN